MNRWDEWDERTLRQGATRRSTEERELDAQCALSRLCTLYGIS